MVAWLESSVVPVNGRVARGKHYMNTTFPARLHVLLTQQSDLGVVIRRGPSKWVCTLLWDRRNDEFQPGQWLKGRIYERRRDL